MQKPFENFDYKENYAEEDILELIVEQFGKPVKLKSYRYPPKEYRKGVVFYIHGYGSYANANGMLAKCLAEHNYEVFALDQRGFGFSEGQRAIIESTDDVYNDQWFLIFEAIKQFKINQQKTPIFLFGRSFGGLLATNMANGPIASNLFTGVATLTPYYRVWTDKLYNCNRLLSFLDNIYPHYMIPSEFQEPEPEWMEKWGELERDPATIGQFTARTGKIWIDEQEKAQQSLLNTDLPFLFIEAENDGVVRNDYIRSHYEKTKQAGKRNEFVTVSGKWSDHTIVSMDPILGSIVMKNVIRFFDNLIKEKEAQKAENLF